MKRNKLIKMMENNQISFKNNFEYSSLIKNHKLLKGDILYK